VNAGPLLDTHFWVWWIMGDPRLRPAEREALDSLPRDQRPILCDISLWEFGTLVDLGRVEIGCGVREWLEVAASPACVRLQSITPGTIEEMNRLPAGFQRDPADHLIVATARALKVPLASADERIRKSKLVPIWRQR
jgi:PIN domain nuclease of toxin-antitoxin system